MINSKSIKSAQEKIAFSMIDESEYVELPVMDVLKILDSLFSVASIIGSYKMATAYIDNNDPISFTDGDGRYVVFLSEEERDRIASDFEAIKPLIEM